MKTIWALTYACEDMDGREIMGDMLISVYPGMPTAEELVSKVDAIMRREHFGERDKGLTDNDIIRGLTKDGYCRHGYQELAFHLTKLSPGELYSDKLINQCIKPRNS